MHESGTLTEACSYRDTNIFTVASWSSFHSYKCAKAIVVRSKAGHITHQQYDVEHEGALHGCNSYGNGLCW